MGCDVSVDSGFGWLVGVFSVYRLISFSRERCFLPPRVSWHISVKWFKYPFSKNWQGLRERGWWKQLYISKKIEKVQIHHLSTLLVNLHIPLFGMRFIKSKNVRVGRKYWSQHLLIVREMGLKKGFIQGHSTRGNRSAGAISHWECNERTAVGTRHSVHPLSRDHCRKRGDTKLS